MSATLKLWIMIGLVILGLAGSTLWLSERLATAREELASTIASVESLSSDLEALRAQQGRVQASINNLNQRSAENERRIQNSLRQNPDWARGPVPDDVAGELCKFAACAGRDPAGQM